MLHHIVPKRNKTITCQKQNNKHMRREDKCPLTRPWQVAVWPHAESHLPFKDNAPSQTSSGLECSIVPLRMTNSVSLHRTVESYTCTHMRPLHVPLHKSHHSIPTSPNHTLHLYLAVPLSWNSSASFQSLRSVQVSLSPLKKNYQS